VTDALLLSSLARAIYCVSADWANKKDCTLCQDNHSISVTTFRGSSQERPDETLEESHVISCSAYCREVEGW